MMDLLEKVKHFIEEENYNVLEVIYNAELAKLGKCAVISKKILLAEDQWRLVLMGIMGNASPPTEK